MTARAHGAGCWARPDQSSRYFLPPTAGLAAPLTAAAAALIASSRGGCRSRGLARRCALSPQAASRCCCVCQPPVPRLAARAVTTRRRWCLVPALAVTPSGSFGSDAWIEPGPCSEPRCRSSGLRGNDAPEGLLTEAGFGRPGAWFPPAATRARHYADEGETGTVAPNWPRDDRRSESCMHEVTTEAHGAAHLGSTHRESLPD